MKKLLLAIMVYTSLLTVSISASEIDMSKEDMMRGNPTPSSEMDSGNAPASAPLIATRQPIASELEQAPSDKDVVSMEETPKKEDRSTLAVVLGTVLILIIVGLGSTFVTRYALSIRDKNNNIYEKKHCKKDKE